MFSLAENRKIASSECNGAFPATRKGKVERNKKKKKGGGGGVDKYIPCNSSEYLNRIILSQKLSDLLYSRINCTS